MYTIVIKVCNAGIMWIVNVLKIVDGQIRRACSSDYMSGPEDLSCPSLQSVSLVSWLVALVVSTRCVLRRPFGAC